LLVQRQAALLGLSLGLAAVSSRSVEIQIGDVHKRGSKVNNGGVVVEYNEHLAVNKMFHRLSLNNATERPGLYISFEEMLHLDDNEDAAGCS
jgi:hypothetical protein